MYNPLRLVGPLTSVVCDIPSIEIQPGKFEARVRNSWGEGYSEGPWAHAVSVTEAASLAKGPEQWLPPLGPPSLADFFCWTNGIDPYMMCPWCEYVDVNNEFCPYSHPYDTSKQQDQKGSTECGQCSAAGPTALFLLAYDPQADLYDCERYRGMYLEELENHQMFKVTEDWKRRKGEKKR